MGWEERLGHGFVNGPNGLSLHYANPREEFGNFLFDYGRVTGIKLYGAKLLENIIQFLARIIVMSAALRLGALGFRFVLQAHDELAFIVPDAEVDRFKVLVHTEMTRCPAWAPDLPLTAEVGVGQSYGEAK
jgi:DNA polymerase